MPSKTKVYKGPKRTRTVTKKKVGGKTIKETVVRKKGTTGNTGVIKSKRVIKGEKGKMTALGRYKVKDKSTKRVRKLQEHGVKSKIKKLSKANKGKKFLSGKLKKKRA